MKIKQDNSITRKIASCVPVSISCQQYPQSQQALGIKTNFNSPFQQGYTYHFTTFANHFHPIKPI